MKPKNHLIRIRVSKEEKEKIEQIAGMLGYGSVSDFSRSRLLDNQLLVIQRLNEIKDLLERKEVANHE
ncbi:MAG: plasmid mobilization protein [Candidatus Woesearchaeota archaeon]